VAQAVLQANQPPAALAAELAMRYRDAEHDLAFEAALAYRAPDRLRLIAYRDMVVELRPIFDLLLHGERYRLTITDEQGIEQHYAGAASELHRHHPRMAAFSWAREALFAPGVGAQPPVIPEAQGAWSVGGQLASGARARYHIAPDGLVVAAELLAPGGERYRIQYAGRREGLPLRVELYDAMHGATTTARLITRAGDPLDAVFD
jgi:hypothetical protein